MQQATARETKKMTPGVIQHGTGKLEKDKKYWPFLALLSGSVFAPGIHVSV